MAIRGYGIGSMLLVLAAAGRVGALDEAYETLLANPRVTAAIESNPFIEPGAYLDFLVAKIEQLESGETESWADARHPVPYTDQELAEVVLQKAALSLYVEVNELVPWSLLDYDDENLHIILGDAFSEKRASAYWEFYVRFNANPLVPLGYADKIRERYPDAVIDSPKALLDQLIIRMRADGWEHVSSGFDWADACAEIGYMGMNDFECTALVKRGASGLTPVFIYSVLHAQNVPSRLIFWFGHGGIEFPSLGIGMDGDGVYSRLNNGIRIRPNSIPVDHSYLELTLFEEWSALSECEGNHRESRHDALQYLSLYDDPEWNADVLASFCLRSPPNSEVPGEFLQHQLVDAQTSIFCQNDDSAGEDYQAPALSDAEFAAWFADIAEVAVECAPCASFDACWDERYCNGFEICDKWGYCELPQRTPVCDDGRVCTVDYCDDIERCQAVPVAHGDVNGDSRVDIFDILCVLDGFVGNFENCALAALDIGNCRPDDVIDIHDILAVLDGFLGVGTCCPD